MYKKKALMQCVSVDEVNRDYFLLYAYSKKGMKGCFLKNSFSPPYKKPPLISLGMPPNIHDLLRPLKIAHMLLVDRLVQLGENPVGNYHLTHVIYNVERLFPYDCELTVIAKSCLSQKNPMPFLVDGFCLENNDGLLRYSLELAPFFDIESQYERYYRFDTSKLFIHPLKTAAMFYNECVEALHAKGVYILPHAFVDVFSCFSDFGLPPGSICFDF